MGDFREYLNESKGDTDGKAGPDVGDKKEYQAFFDKTLKKYKIQDPSDLSPENKKKFFDEIDAGWKGNNEKD